MTTESTTALGLQIYKIIISHIIGNVEILYREEKAAKTESLIFRRKGNMIL